MRRGLQEQCQFTCRWVLLRADPPRVQGQGVYFWSLGRSSKIWSRLSLDSCSKCVLERGPLMRRGGGPRPRRVRYAMGTFPPEGPIAGAAQQRPGAVSLACQGPLCVLSAFRELPRGLSPQERAWMRCWQQWRTRRSLCCRTLTLLWLVRMGVL